MVRTGAHRVIGDTAEVLVGGAGDGHALASGGQDPDGARDGVPGLHGAAHAVHVVRVLAHVPRH
eukprot:12191538-Heterocapsa_arctica.AAC.1